MHTMVIGVNIMPKIYLSPSTQEFNITVGGTTEEEIMNLVADAMIPYLTASRIDYVRNSRDMTVADTAQEANESDVDFYLSLHSNAAGEANSGRIRGAEIYYYPTSAESRRAAVIFANNYKLIYPLPNRVSVIPLGTFIELNRTTMPAILFELVYHDNLQDYVWLTENLSAVAENLTASLADYFGIPFITPYDKSLQNI